MGWIGSAEANKIMTADKHRCGFRHLLDVQLVLDPPHMSFYERLLSPGNLIQVDARASVMARVKTPAGTLEIENSEVGGNKNNKVENFYLKRLFGPFIALSVAEFFQRLEARIGLAPRPV